MRPSRAISMQPFRADDWWRSKASQLMGLVYLFTLCFGISFVRFIPLAIWSVIVIAGFASFGYLVNDLFDKEKDRHAGKKNFLLGKSRFYQSALTTASLMLIALPWIYLPIDRVSIVLIAVELSLFILYSAPASRWKEKGVLGIIIDALYAHAIPTTLAAYTFYLASPIELSYAGFFLLFAWQFLCGVRNILIHQLEDQQADISSGTSTYIIAISRLSAVRMIRYSLLSELIAYSAFFIFLATYSYWFIACVAIALILSYESIISYRQIQSDDIPPVPIRYFPNNVYEKWLPALFLIFLSSIESSFLIFLAIHITFFNFILAKEIASRVYHLLIFIKFKILIPARNVLSKAFNYCIYYLMLVFGVNLRHEQISAIDYFRKRWRAYK